MMMKTTYLKTTEAHKKRSSHKTTKRATQAHKKRSSP
jgi:hypothetical protein